MPKVNLRAVFALGVDSSIAAQQVFTDRVTELAAFDAAVENLDAALGAAGVSPVIDRGAPRKNVLVYYGVGGIGKTTLSQEFEQRLLRDEDRAEPVVAVRVDFAEASAFDLESYVLRLRAGLGAVSGRWSAFDLAFSVYWQRAHPGQPLEEFVTRDSVLRRTARSAGLANEVSASAANVIATALPELLGAVLPGVVGASHRLAQVVYRHARQAVVQHRVLRDCELLPELLEADADLDTLSYFPYLLAWDLHRLGGAQPRAVVFLDTFEEVTAQPTRQLERWLQNAVALADAALAQPNLPDGLHRFLLLHHGHALRVSGRYAEAAAGFERIRAHPGRFSAEAGYWLADYGFLDGRFHDALAALDQLPEPTPALRGEILRPRGHIYRVNALFDRAEAYGRAALDLARATGNLAAEGKALTDLIQTLTWHRPDDARGLWEQATDVNERLHNRVELVKLHAAIAVSRTNFGEFDAAEQQISRGLDLTVRCGYRGGEIWCWVARIFNHLRRGDHTGAVQAAEHVSGLVTRLGGNRYWAEIVHWWTDAAATAPQAAAGWVDGVEPTRARWRAVVAG